MKNHDIRAPRTPRGENKAVTIANQENQIKLLIDRCAALEKQRSVAEGNLQFQTAAIVERDAEIKDLRQMLESCQTELQYSNGYIARVKECDAMPAFPSCVPGA